MQRINVIVKFRNSTVIFDSMLPKNKTKKNKFAYEKKGDNNETVVVIAISQEPMSSFLREKY